MEQSEEELLRSRLFNLCELTVCNKKFLNFFNGKRILQETEIEVIESEKSNFDKAAEFYKIIRKKAGAFYALLEGLAATNQTGAISLLKEAKENDESIVQNAQMKVNNWIREKPSLSGLSASTSRKKSGISFEVDLPVHNFVGRIDELAKLHEIVIRNENAKRISVISQLTSISGLGGIGKTQLAREYVQVHGSEFDDNTIWLNADTEKSLYDSFKRLASETLHLSTRDVYGKEKDAKVIAQEIYKYFEGCKVLFVLDNAEKVPWLKDFMPLKKINPNLYLLITSRDREWDRRIEVVELGGFSEKDAVTLVQQELKINTDDKNLLEDVTKLVNTLQCFPLALQQAVAYISEQQITFSYSISDYLVDFEAKKLQLLSFREENTLGDETFEATTATTWSITMDKIKQHSEYKLIAPLIMNTIAYLSPDNIERAFFYQLPSNFAKFEEKVSSDSVIGAVRLLIRYSMLNGRENQSVLSVHRLVQAVTRCQIIADEMEEKFLNLLLKMFINGDKKISEGNAYHAMTVCRHAWKYKSLIETHSSLIRFILWSVCDAAYHQQGLEFGYEALENFKESLGEDHLECLDIERHIANILKNQGHYEKSITIYKKLLEKNKANFRRHIGTYVSLLHDLGDALRRVEKYTEAIEVQKYALELGAVFNCETKEEHLMFKNNYGMTLMESGQKEEALKVFQDLVKVHTSLGNTNSLELFRVQAYIANIKLENGNYEEAELLFQQILEKINPNWTADVELYGYLCGGLGRLLLALERHDEAINFLEENLIKIKEKLGDQHYRTLGLMSYIANAYSFKGDLEKAFDIQKNVHLGYLHLFGENSVDRDMLAQNNNFAILLSNLGRHGESFKLFRKNLDNMKAFREHDKEVIRTKWQFALSIERSDENLQLAMKLLKEVTEAFELLSKPEYLVEPYQLQNVQMDLLRIQWKLQGRSDSGHKWYREIGRTGEKPDQSEK